MSLASWLILAATAVIAVRQVRRLVRDVRAGPLPDVAAAPDDAEPMAHVLPNDDGWFTWSLRFPEDPPATGRKH